MRKLALLVLLVTLALPAVAGTHVTVDQLEQALSAGKGIADGDLAKQLAGLELTQRVSTARLAQWKANLPGPEAKRELTALVDASAFLDPPPAEFLVVDIPDIVTQQKMIAAAADYLSNTIPTLPDFFATRDTVLFEDRPKGIDAKGKPDNGHEPLHAVLGSSSVRVIYSDSREIVNSQAATATGTPDRKSSQMDQGLSVWGVFGPILRTVLSDASQGKISWARWEQGTSGPAAVFRYAVPIDASNYELKWCCFFSGQEPGVLLQMTGYHGEMAIDPSTGAILRLTLMSDLQLDLPLWEADMMVEYGPVEIGGKTYICPLKSVSLSLAWTPGLLYGGNFSYPEQGIMKTLVNDVTFRDYNLFRPKSHIITGETG